MENHVLSKAKEGLSSTNLRTSLNKVIKTIVLPTEEVKKKKNCDISPQNITKVEAIPEITTLLLTGCKGKATFWNRMREGVHLYPAATETEKWYVTQSLIPEEAHSGKNRIIVK